MPIYEYACQACHHQFDKIQKFSDEPLVTCPQCGKDSLEKLVSAPGFQLKGSGWYVTDFRDKPKSTTESSSETSSTTTTSSTSDTSST